jgi:glycine/D-amino acid oxidase-like deaminating enzyme
MTRTIGDDCGFSRRKSLQFASSPRDVASWRRSTLHASPAGIASDLLGPHDVRAMFPFSRAAALLSYDAGEIDAYRLTHALLRHAIGNGLRAFDRTRHDDRPRPAPRRSPHRPRTARLGEKIVFATGYETDRYLRDSRVKLRTTYAIASEPVRRSTAGPTAA